MITRTTCGSWKVITKASSFFFLVELEDEEKSFIICVILMACPWPWSQLFHLPFHLVLCIEVLSQGLYINQVGNKCLRCGMLVLGQRKLHLIVGIGKGNVLGDPV